MIFLVVIMNILGFILLGISLIDQFTSNNPEKERNLSLFIVGSILLIPGIYYLIRII